MAARVGQRLLRDPERRQGDGVRQALGPRSVDLQVDVDTILTGARHEAGEPIEAGCGRERRVAVGAVAQHAEDRAQLADRVAAGVLDRLQRVTGVRGIPVEQLSGGGGLDVDRRERMGHHVVQIARDAQPLLLGAALGLLLARALGEREALPEQLEVRVTGAMHIRDQERDRDQQDVAERLKQGGRAAV